MSHVLDVSIHMLSPFVICRYHIWPCFRTLVLQPSWSRGHHQGRRETSTEECRLFNCYYIMKSMMWSFNSSSKNLKLYQLLVDLQQRLCQLSRTNIYFYVPSSLGNRWHWRYVIHIYTHMHTHYEVYILK